MPTLASLLTYGIVTDSFFAEIQDTDQDALNLPDLVAVGGTVTFTPGLADGEVLLFTSVPATQKVMPVVAAYDDQGRLSLNGQPFVKLQATDNAYASRQGWTWTVSFANLAVNGVPVKRASFSFYLPGSSLPVDLAQLQPVTTQNGAAVIKGDPGLPGPGVVFRGTRTGTDSSVLPTGFAAAQNGYTYRVLSADLTYDEMWVWVWSGSAGSWVDNGPMPSGAIDDSTVTPSSTWSSQKIADFSGGSGGGGDVFYIYQDLATGVYPLAITKTTRDDNSIVWVGRNFPQVGSGYARPVRTVNGVIYQDGFEGVA